MHLKLVYVPSCASIVCLLSIVAIIHLHFFNKKMSRSTLRLPGHALFDNFCFRQAKHETSTGGSTIIEIRNSTCCYIDFDKAMFLMSL